jgi:Peroxiredoxin
MQKGDNKILWILILVLALILGTTYYQHYKTPAADQPTPQSTSNTGSGKAAQGKLAPDITLNDLNGQTVKLSDYRGKVVILNFWASWCPPCKSEMSDLDGAAREFSKGNNAVLLAVNLTDGSRETSATASKYITDNKFSMTVLLDTKSNAANAYNITSIPTTYIIDKQGIIVNSIIGPTTKDALIKYADQLK